MICVRCMEYISRSSTTRTCGDDTGSRAGSLRRCHPTCHPICHPNAPRTTVVRPSRLPPTVPTARSCAIVIPSDCTVPTLPKSCSLARAGAEWDRTHLLVTLLAGPGRTPAFRADPPWHTHGTARRQTPVASGHQRARRTVADQRVRRYARTTNSVGSGLMHRSSCVERRPLSPDGID
jgi:hypothetical protein